MAFGERLAGLLGGMGRGLAEAIPPTIEATGAGFLAGTYPEMAIKLQEAERERLWKQEEQRRREEAAMLQMQEKLLADRALREEMFTREAGLRRELAGESREQQRKMAELQMNLELGMKFLLEGTPEGRALGYKIIEQYAPSMQQFFEGKGIPLEAPTPEAPVTPSIITPQLREGVIADVPTAKAPTVKAKIPKLITKELKKPPEFAELEYALNAVGMEPESQAQIMGMFVKNLLQKKLADPAYQIDGKPYVIGGIWMANFKDGSSRPLTDDKGNVVVHIEIEGSGTTGWWRVNNFRAMQGAKDAVQMVIAPASPTDPLSARQKWLEDAINLKIPSAETFKFGEKGKAIIPRHWFGAKELPWGPTAIPTKVEDVIRDLGIQYYLDLKVEYNKEDDSWSVAVLRDLAPQYKGIAPSIPTGRFEQEPLKPTPQALKEQVWAQALKQAEGDKAKARDIAVSYLRGQGYDPTKVAEEQPRKGPSPPMEISPAGGGIERGF